jgi:hypothetical protein
MPLFVIALALLVVLVVFTVVLNRRGSYRSRIGRRMTFLGLTATGVFVAASAIWLVPPPPPSLVWLGALSALGGILLLVISERQSRHP